MTIKATVTKNSDNQLHLLRLEVTEESIANFQTLVDRALNCWDNAPKELKELGDMLTHGRVTQDHTLTKINSSRESNPEYHTAAEQDIIETYIQTNGLEAWLEHLRNGTTNKVLRPGS